MFLSFIVVISYGVIISSSGFCLRILLIVVSLNPICSSTALSCLGVIISYMLVARVVNIILIFLLLIRRRVFRIVVSILCLSVGCAYSSGFIGISMNL